MKHFMYGLGIVLALMQLQSAAFAQITITASDLTNVFGAGISEQTYSNFDSSETMNVGTASSSSSQSWTLPAFTILDSSKIDNVSPASTPYVSDFPGATYAETFSQTDTGITISYYAYLEVSNDSLYAIGTVETESGSYGGHSIDSRIISHEKKFAFHLPLALGDAVVGSADTSSYGPRFPGEHQSSTYDAYGTLTLPNGSFQALRSHNATTFKVYSGGTLVSTSTSYSLEWSTREGHQLTVGIDSGATSGTVKITSVSWTRVEQTPTFVNATPEQPSVFMLSQNYPNPFNPTTVISYETPVTGHVTLGVYDVLGRQVQMLVDGQQSAGVHLVEFNGANLPSGVYFYRLQSGNMSQTKKLMLMK